MDNNIINHLVPMITLNNGAKIPQIGFGTLNVPPDRNPTKENTAITAKIVQEAIEAGYRHIDTAQMYGNEKGVGDGIAASGIPRREIFITSKLGNGNHKPADVYRSFNETLKKLGVEYLDLFLMHWPLPTLFNGDFVSTWKAMAELLEQGKVRSIGVSNFQPTHLDKIINETGIVPVVNQIEIHPGFNNQASVDATLSHGINIEAWSPLKQGKMLDNTAITGIAISHEKTNAQIILRWHIQHGYIVFPKSMHKERMIENISVFDFTLSPEEMAIIDALDEGEAGRTGPNPDTFDWVPK